MTVDLSAIKEIIKAENIERVNLSKSEVESREEVIFNTLAHFFRKAIGKSDEYLLSIFDEAKGPRLIKFTEEGFEEMVKEIEKIENTFVTSPH